MTKNMNSLVLKKSACFTASLFTLFFFLNTSSVFAEGHAAAGAHHVATPWDLIPPFVNFFILLFLVVGKSKNTLRRHFQRNGEHIQLVSEEAEKLYKEATIKLEMYERKLKFCEKECQEILKNMELEYVNFSKKYLKEIEEKKIKMKHEGINMIEQEKTSMMNVLNATFLDAIIEKAENKVRSDKELKLRTTKNILKAANL